MFDSLLSDPFSPWPPTLHFTPEVRAGIRAAADLELGPGWDADPQDLNMDDVAQEIFLNDPNLLALLLGANVDHQNAEPNVISPI